MTIVTATLRKLTRGQIQWWRILTFVSLADRLTFHVLRTKCLCPNIVQSWALQCFFIKFLICHLLWNLLF